MLSGLQAEFALITSYLGSCQYKDLKKKNLFMWVFYGQWLCLHIWNVSLSYKKFSVNGYMHIQSIGAQHCCSKIIFQHVISITCSSSTVRHFDSSITAYKQVVIGCCWNCQITYKDKSWASWKLCHQQEQTSCIQLHPRGSRVRVRHSDGINSGSWVLCKRVI